MKEKIVFFLSTLFFLSCEAPATSPLPPIREVANRCQKAVWEMCQTETCPTFCQKKYERNEKLKQECSKACIPEKSCKIKLFAGQDEEINQVLDEQNREFLMQCIAENRDPEGTKTGRRIFEGEGSGQAWKKVRTPNWTQLTGEVSAKQLK